jgi:predicted O-methyltransferase YrrM
MIFQRAKPEDLSPLHALAEPEERWRLLLDSYLDWYGIARAVRPQRILEIGVLRGFAACAMMLGHKPELYVGMDSEAMEKGSNHIASCNLDKLFHDDESCWSIVHHDIMTTEPIHPQVCRFAPYDLINLDAGHDFDCTLRQLEIGWQFSHDKSVLIVDDARDWRVTKAAELFVGQQRQRKNNVAMTHHDNYNGWVILERGQT